MSLDIKRTRLFVERKLKLFVAQRSVKLKGKRLFAFIILRSSLRSKGTIIYKSQFLNS